MLHWGATVWHRGFWGRRVVTGCCIGALRCGTKGAEGQCLGVAMRDFRVAGRVLVQRCSVAEVLGGGQKYDEENMMRVYPEHENMSTT